MFAVEVYAAVRHFVFIEGNSQRDAARVFELSRETISKMCRFSLPPGHTRVKPVVKPKLGALLPVIDGILKADGTAPIKQRHKPDRRHDDYDHRHGGRIQVSLLSTGTASDASSEPMIPAMIRRTVSSA